MQPYRSARTHGDDCRACVPPFGPGHALCQHGTCQQPAELQYPRHASAAGYATLPESLQPIDGICHQAVFVCGDHEPDPICDHPAQLAPEPVSVDCPHCQAPADEPCLKANGRPRSAPHALRAPAPLPPPVCTHVHREDCEGLGHCECTPDDPAPDRPRRIIAPPALEVSTDAVPIPAA